MAKDQQSKKGLPLRTGKRKSKIAGYYEVRYPARKLRRMVHNGASVAMLRKWADAYKSPSGMSAITSLIKIAKIFGLNINQE